MASLETTLVRSMNAPNKIIFATRAFPRSAAISVAVNSIISISLRFETLVTNDELIINNPPGRTRDSNLSKDGLFKTIAVEGFVTSGNPRFHRILPPHNLLFPALFRTIGWQP